MLLLLCIAIGVSLSPAGCCPAETCTLDDFNASAKVEEWVVYDIQHKGLELTDEMELILYFDHSIRTEEELQQLEDILVEFRIESEYPTGWGPTWLYSARCVIQDICELSELDFLLKVASGEGEINVP